MPTVATIFGTRPEAIKVCPVIRALRAHPAGFTVKVIVTGQHRHLLDQVLPLFGIQPDIDLDIMQPGQTLAQSTSRIISSLGPVLADLRPEMVLVQGDTTTTFCGALTAFYEKIPVGHIEAGLRTHDLQQPFPEELNRVLTTRLTSLHFAATEGGAGNLVREGVDPAQVHVTGNSGIDAVLYIRDLLNSGALQPPEWPWLDPERKLIVVTAHRRESFGGGFENICRALARLAERPDVQIVYPVHPNPNVQAPVRRYLMNQPNLHLIEPLEYVPFVDLMRRAWLLITDSGGVQEEAPSLGKPVLVLREKTERPEAVEAGTVRLVGTDAERIVAEADRLLEDKVLYAQMTRVHNPYGDGAASDRISGLIDSFLSHK